MLLRSAAATAIVGSAVLVGCAVTGSPSTSAMPAHPAVASTAIRNSGPQFRIQHVVIIIQENRTVDNLFNGFPGADTAQQGETHTGKIIPLATVSLASPHDVCHAHGCWETAYDGG